MVTLFFTDETNATQAAEDMAANGMVVEWNRDEYSISLVIREIEVQAKIRNPFALKGARISNMLENRR